ncbi:hypothetical protein DB88DRAFT_489521 [Papiliotrema laurentii]|uniref:Uncharacterized protein n=1 Tax=Papiliotrema laurentii TaxID=5418 RepID=A0AAD9D1E6_PAPLA|nr:hypothetical protein DB88DRAFT_489521 [Papiliotrema laurentii]
MTTFSSRPGTPFPHTHILHHSSTSSTFQPMSASSYFTSQPLHFAPRELPARTPPSLLKRNSSSSSSSARYSPSLPDLIPSTSRRQDSASTSEDSSCESPLLRTPVSEANSPPAPPPTPLALPSSVLKGKGLALPPPEYNWTDKELSPTTSFDMSAFKDQDQTPKRPALTRPKLQRRDTPRPPASFSPTVSPAKRARDEARNSRRQLTSMVDGGSWLVIE